MTNDAIDEYVQLFSEKYNIGTIVQVSCFPFKMYQAWGYGVCYKQESEKDTLDNGVKSMV